MDYINIAPEQAQALLASGEITLVLDTRELHEWQAGHLDYSVVLPVPSGQLEVAARLQQLAPARDQAVLVHCRSGVRSLRVMPQIAGYGFRKIYHLPGGILSWVQAGLPLVA